MIESCWYLFPVKFFTLLLAVSGIMLIRQNWHSNNGFFTVSCGLPFTGIYGDLASLPQLLLVTISVYSKNNVDEVTPRLLWCD